MWKYLTHPNILTLLGVTTTPFQLISTWMPGGTLPEYIKKNPNADRLGLVGALSVVFAIYPLLTAVTSYPMSPGASATSTPVM